MKIICINCPEGSEEIEEEMYAEHMKTVHKGKDQIEDLKTQKAIKKNIPKVSKDLPPGIKPEDLPSDEFLKTMEEMEKEQSKPKEPKSQAVAPVSPPTKPIELTYKYLGDCDKGHGVSTLEMDVEKKHFAIAFCLQCNRQIESRDVAKL